MAEWQVFNDPRLIGVMHQGGLGEVPLALGTLGGEQMPPGSLGAQNLAGASDFESLGDRLFRLAACNGFRHGREEGREARGNGKGKLGGILDF